MKIRRDPSVDDRCYDVAIARSRRLRRIAEAKKKEEDMLALIEFYKDKGMPGTIDTEEPSYERFDPYSVRVRSTYYG